MVVLLLSSRGARLLDLPEPLPEEWLMFDTPRLKTSYLPDPLPPQPIGIFRRQFFRADTYTYVEREPAGVRR